METLFGCYEHSLDEKGRLMIPSKLRESLGSTVYILKGFDGPLSVYRAETFEKMVKEAEALPFNIKDNRSYLRAQLGSVSELTIDRLGRVQLPTLLLNKFRIGREVTILGVGDHFEIWDRETYNRYEEEVNGNFEGIAENIRKDNA